MTQDEIIRMAREAGMTVFVIESLERFAAIVAAHERKKQAEQEPVGVVIGGVFEPWNDDVLSGAWEIYAAPVRTKDLTDDEILACGGMDGADDWAFEFARAVIAKFKEKNK